MREQLQNSPSGLFDSPPPRILVIDDLFGRVTVGEANPERRDLCGQFLLEDVSYDLRSGHGTQKIKRPVAQAVFCRGQIPKAAAVGDTIENDLAGTLAFVHRHWEPPRQDAPPLSMVLLDLCFYTGRVTQASESRRGMGMPAGRDEDDRPDSYFGLRVLEALHDRFPDLPVVILSSMPRDGVSQQFSRLGALGFLPRGEPNSPAVLRDYLWRHGLLADTSGTVIGRSRGLLLALRAARRAAVSRKGVLLRGDTGTGKELLARYLHNQTPEIGDAPYVPVDSGALTPSLYASELFGHRRGAFTGATADRTGRIVQADGGDLFLDEIGNMPDDVQTGLLRAIDQKEVTPVGAQASQHVDVRFITATNVDIEGRAATGHGFRADLYYRLREGGVIHLPPLRDRKEDIPLLVEEFVRNAEAVTVGTMQRSVDPQALEVLVQHDWPGNIRELRDAVFRAVNENPDVEYLVPGHLALAGTTASPLGDLAPTPEFMCKKGATLDGEPLKLTDLFELARRIDVDTANVASWIGCWTALQEAHAEIAARLLRASLLATCRVDVKSPEGEVRIHPATRLLTGDATLTASQGADLIKRIFSAMPASARERALADPVLRCAYDVSLRLRPRRAKRGRTS